MQNIEKSGAAAVKNCRRRRHHTQKIAMLTDIYENNRQKCAAYFPDTIDSIRIFSSRGGECTLADTQIPTSYINRCFNDDIATSSCQTNDDDAEDIYGFDVATLSANYFLIKNTAIITKNGYTIRKLVLCYLNRTNSGRNAAPPPTFNINHYWFPDWPDHRSPDDIDVLLDMSLDLLDDDESDEDDEGDEVDEEDSGSNDDDDGEPTMPQQKSCVAVNAPLPVIHCSAGIGRTGCLAAILNGLRQMRGSSVVGGAAAASINNSVDILGIVCNLRLQRGGMVQNSEQYELIHRALCLYHQRRNNQQQNTLLRSNDH